MPKKEFTVSEVMMFQEDMNKKIDVIGEQFSYIAGKLEKIDKMEEDISTLKTDMKIVKLTLTQKVDVSEFKNHELRISQLEKAVS